MARLAPSHTSRAGVQHHSSLGRSTSSLVVTIRRVDRTGLPRVPVVEQKICSWATATVAQAIKPATRIILASKRLGAAQ